MLPGTADIVSLHLNRFNSIGVFDSGIGGLSVLKEIRKIMPDQHLIYFGDQIHVPYGRRSIEQVRQFSFGITNFLLEQGAKLIVIACNAASAASLIFLREQFPQIPFVGMEPALKPAAEKTHSGAVAVLATQTTFQGQLYASVMERFARDVTVFQDPCPGLVEEIEQGHFNGNKTRAILEKALIPLLTKNIDTVVLGCTHYPHVIPLIKEIVGENVNVIDPAPAVAIQTRKIYLQMNFQDTSQNKIAETWITSSSPKEPRGAIVRQLFPYRFQICHAKWNDQEDKLNLTHEKNVSFQ
ncbi:MAG: glutamate racemase [Chloroflexi bacterium 44-23]|nr:MAG: glutamate racemase [Chloroflexi bacterium 44-23]